MLARHELGIMQNAPKPRKRYDEYEPQKYNCISVDNEYVEIIDANLHNADFYWHTLDGPAKGLAYTGVTLIPPTSIQAFIAVIKDITKLNELKNYWKKHL